jgi:hypothetical protein
MISLCLLHERSEGNNYTRAEKAQLITLVDRAPTFEGAKITLYTKIVQKMFLFITHVFIITSRFFWARQD